MSKHFTVCLIDDNKWHAELVRVLLDDELFGFVHWDRPAEAWNGVTADAAPDLVILDLDFDEVRGARIAAADLLEHLRVRWRGVPVIAMSASPHADVVRRTLAQGVTEFIAQPYDVRVLLGVVYRELGRAVEGHTAELNAQHLAIAHAFRPLLGARCPGRSALQSLHGRLSAHFAFEEGFMRRHGYPGVARHAEQHARLLHESQQLLHRATLEAAHVERLWRHVNGDINDDRDYVEFLAAVGKSLQDRLSASAA